MNKSKHLSERRKKKMEIVKENVKMQVRKPLFSYITHYT